MDANPILRLMAETFEKFHLDPIIIGNAGAALNGAPVTTLDIDYLVEQTDENFRKIMVIGSFLHCEVLELTIPKPNVHYVYQLKDESKHLSVDILYQISGVSVETVRRNAWTMTVDGHTIKVAALSDIIASKQAAGREKDRAVLPILLMTQNEQIKSAQNNQTERSR